MKSIYLRNFLASVLMMLMCLLVVAVIFVAVGRGYIIGEYKQNMLASADEIRRVAAAVRGSDRGDDLTLQIYVTSIANSTGNLVTLADDTGTVFLCSEALCLHRDKVIPPEYLARIRSEGIEEMTQLGGVLEEGRFVVAVPAENIDTGNLIGYVIVSAALSDILTAWNRMLGLIGIVAAVVFIAFMLLALVYWRRMSQPLDEIADASRHFARGDFSVRVKQVGDPDDEMGALIESFNSMADSLESAEKRRSEFISNVSHELRTPMTTIGGFADGLLDGTIPDSDRERYLAAISDETHRLTRLVRGMLDASRAESGSAVNKRTDFDLTELTLQTLLSFEARATEKNLDVDPQLPDSNIMVNADRDAITRVIYNLIDNAVKFSKEGGCITLRLYKDANKAYVSVRDEGETIPKEDLPFIFDRFHKSDRSRSIDKDGVGLGLYLVKKIINDHDEDIAVKSENGMTEFTFSLQLTQPRK